MLGMTSVYSIKEHSLVGGEIGAYIKRIAKETGRDFAVVRYNKLAVFCIIEFLSPRKDVFIDVMNLGKSLANFDYHKGCEFRQRVFKPLTCNETSRVLAENESSYLHERQDDNEAEGERLERISMGE